MAQPNVVREPSMDEILASIRRIIESNEPVPSSGLATSRAEPQGFSGAPANDQTSQSYTANDDVSLTVDDDLVVAEFEAQNAVDSRISAEPAAPTNEYVPVGSAGARVTETGSAPKALSLADVAARVRAASDRNIAMRDMQMRTPSPEPQSPLLTGRMAQASHGVSPRDANIAAVAASEADLRNAIQIDAPATSQYDADEEDDDVHFDIDEQLEARAAELDRMDRSSRDEIVLEEAPVLDEREPTTAPIGQALVSAETGHQVAQSFHDLTEALAQAERRSLDEIAEDMLRPMLQEWLDDNLPTLVERLVREEIERVARGPRR